MNRISCFSYALIGFLMMGFLACQSPSQSTDFQHFQLHPDFAIQASATEPLVFDPVDMEFDAQGRAFVLEMPGYPRGQDQSRLVWLEDTDQDGLFDRRHVFAENLALASSLLPYRDGFLIAAPPNLLYIRDTDGDMKADEREIMLSGFDVGNLQHNVNGLTYGLDNWLYAANGGNSGKVYWPDETDSPLPMRGQDLRFRLPSQELELVGESSGGFGLAMDEWGHLYETHNLYHISQLVFPGRYLAGLATEPAHSLHNISDHNDGELSRLYPLGRQAMRVNHPEQAGYFSGSCGITYYGGGAFPTGFENNVFVADVVLNLIHRDALSSAGTHQVASRKEEKKEFLASTDRAFRPVNMTVGPDGALYVLDMHRDVIEHPEWIPDEIEDTLDLDAGKDQGRIYRIVPKKGLSWQAPSFSRESPQELVAALAHPNQWWRLTAQRLLVEWQLPESLPLLQDLAQHSPEPLARLHSLWALHGLQKLDKSLLQTAIKDPEAGIRKQALLMAESFFPEDPSWRGEVLALSNDPDPEVQMQMALSLSLFPDLTPADLIPLLQQSLDDPWQRLAILSAGQRHAGHLLLELFSTDPLRRGANEMAHLLAIQSGRQGTAEQQIQILAQLQQPALTRSVLTGMAVGLQDRADNTSRFSASEKASLAAALGKIETQEGGKFLVDGWEIRQVLGLPAPKGAAARLASAQETALSETASLSARLAAVELLGFEKLANKQSTLLALVQPQQANALQLAALRQLATYRTPAVSQQLVAAWPSLGPEARRGVSDLLLYYPENHPLLLEALESGKIKVGEMNFHLERRRELLFSEVEEVRNRAAALFSDAGVVTRKQVMEQMRPALSLAGDVANGKQIFGETCSSCHQLGNQGMSVGPDLTEMSRKSRYSLLHEILDPNAAADTRYLSHRLETSGGEVLIGIIAAENDESLQLKMMGGLERTIPRREIKRLESTGLSLMPEGLEAGMEAQQLADLIAYLQQPNE